MREIELKFKTDDPNTIIDFLKKNGCPIDPEKHQYDTVYVKNKDNIEEKEGSVFLRIRKNDEKIKITYKKRSSKVNESQEIEFGVDSYELANEFIKAIGFQEWVQVNKVRVHSKYKEFNICIDEVEKLGSFIEIELLIEHEDNNDHESRIMEIAKELGIPLENRIDTHYDTMIAKTQLMGREFYE